MHVLGLVSYSPTMSDLVQKGIKIIIVTGDADLLCSWRGTEAVARNIHWPGYKEFDQQKLRPYLVDGQKKGSYKNTDVLSLVRVFKAGHDVAQFRGYWEGRL